MSEKIVINIPIAASSAVITAEIEPDYFGHQVNASEVLSTLVTAFYGYPITVTVETDPVFTFGED